MERGVDPETGRRRLVGRLDLLHLGAHPVGEIGPESAQRRSPLDGQRLLRRLGPLPLVQEPEVLHPAEDDVAPLAGARGVLERRVGVRGPDDPGQGGALAEREPLDLLAEEAARGGPDPVDGEAAVLPEIDAVQVRREDLVLLVAPLDDEGERRLLELPSHGPLRREDEVLDELLGQRASPLDELAAPDVDPERSAHRPEVDARVLVEAVVLGGEHGLDQVLRHGGERDRVAELVGALAEPGERFGLELDLPERLAAARGQLADPTVVEREPELERRPRALRIVARAEMEVPGARLAAELARRPRRGARLPVPEAAEGAAEVGGLDRDAGRQHLACRVDPGRVLQPSQVDAGRRPPGPHPQASGGPRTTAAATDARRRRRRRPAAIRLPRRSRQRRSGRSGGTRVTPCSTWMVLPATDVPPRSAAAGPPAPSRSSAATGRRGSARKAQGRCGRRRV